MFASNQLTDYSILSKFTRLKGLNINGVEGSQISDISFLANLNSLRFLHLHNNLISDITPLANLESLEYLGLHNNCVTDIRPLVDNQNLTEKGQVELGRNNLDTTSTSDDMQNILTLISRGVEVRYDKQK